MTRTIRRAAASAILLATLALLLPAAAQDQAAPVLPQATTATYQDWTLRCDHLQQDPPGKVCEVVQAVRAADGQSVLAQIVLGRPAPGQPIKLIVQLPAGVWLPANTSLSAPDGQSVTAIYTRCQQLCVADADASDALVDALKAANDPAKLSFQDGNRRVIELPVSLNGFTAAMEAGSQ